MTGGKGLEAIGLVTVVLSLLFVAYEIRQSNQIALVANVNAVYSSFTNINEALMNDPELAPLLDKAWSDVGIDELTSPEKIRLRAWIRILMNTWLPANIAYDEGQLAQATYDSIFDDATNSLNVAGPGMVALWNEVVLTYPGLEDLEILKFLKAEIARREDEFQSAQPIGD